MSIARQLSTGYAKLAALSPEGYSAALHIRYAYPLATHITYPSQWIEYYTDNAFALRDPLVAWALSTEGAIRWSEICLPDPFGIFEKGEEFGLKFGVAISVGELQSRSVVGCARGDREFSDSEIKEIQSVVKFLHETAAPRLSLTGAQLQALRCIASGDRHAAAAAKLGISESALKARLQSARERLVARTTSEAIQKAKEIRLL